MWLSVDLFNWRVELSEPWEIYNNQPFQLISNLNHLCRLDSCWNVARLTEMRWCKLLLNMLQEYRHWHEKEYPKSYSVGIILSLQIGMTEKVIYKYRDKNEAQWNNLIVHIECIILMGNKWLLLSLNIITGNCFYLGHYA